MGKSILLITLFLIALSNNLFSFPKIDSFGFYGSVVYTSDNRVEGYIINRYNRSEQKVRDEYYNSQGHLIKYNTFKYDSEDNLLEESEYNKDKNLVESIQYEMGLDQTKRKVVRSGGQTYYVDYEYSYYNDRKIRQQIETTNYSTGYYRDRQRVKKTVYRYLRQGKMVEHYAINGASTDYQFQSAEVFRYFADGKIAEILRLDQYKRPVKYFEYSYNRNAKIASIKVYKVNHYYFEWRGGIRSFPKKNLIMKNSFIYEYSADRFNRFKDNQLAFNSSDGKSDGKKIVRVTVIRDASSEGDGDKGDDDDNEGDDDGKGDNDKETWDTGDPSDVPWFKVR
ncbi:MAG: hypothetical protein IEMM0008_1094 [bacterium]|nr:MAG: hypothetical protein IEMM0008_1094 [bacterium]